MTLTERAQHVLADIDAKLDVLPDGDLHLALRCLKTAIEGLIWIYDHNAHHTTERAISALTTLCDTWENGK